MRDPWFKEEGEGGGGCMLGCEGLGVGTQPSMSIACKACRLSDCGAAALEAQGRQLTHRQCALAVYCAAENG
jgi:hypothetical protein